MNAPREANRTRRKGHELRPLWVRRTHNELVRRFERKAARSAKR